MGDELHLTIEYADDGELITAHVAELPGVTGRGRTCQEAKADVLKTLEAAGADRRHRATGKAGTGDESRVVGYGHLEKRTAITPEQRRSMILVYGVLLLVLAGVGLLDRWGVL